MTECFLDGRIQPATRQNAVLRLEQDGYYKPLIVQSVERAMEMLCERHGKREFESASATMLIYTEAKKLLDITCAAGAAEDRSSGGRGILLAANARAMLRRNLRRAIPAPQLSRVKKTHGGENTVPQK